MEVMEPPVVGEDLHLVVGEDDTEEAGAAAGTLAGLVEARGGRAAVVAVGNVEAGDGEELLRDESDIVGGVDGPGGMADAVGGGEVEVGGGGGELAEEVIEGGDGTVGEEGGAGLGAEGFDMTDAVIFLIGAG